MTPLASWAGRATIFIATVLLLSTVLVADARGADLVVTQRLAGDDRFSTAAMVARAAFPSGSDVAVLVSGVDSADSLAASGLSGALADVAGVSAGPVLLSQRDHVPEATWSALDRLGVEKVVLVGGKAAIADTVEADLAARYQVVRVAGSDRFGTAAEAARRGARVEPGENPFVGGEAVFVVNGDRPSDGLAAGPAAHLGSLPVILTLRDHLPAVSSDVLRELEPTHAVIVGGTAAVSDGVKAELAALGIPQVIRLAGATGADTATRAADFMRWNQRAPVTTAILTSRGSHSDALAGAPLGGQVGAPVLVLDSNANSPLDPSTRDWLVTNCARLRKLTVLGGERAISQDTARAAADAADRCNSGPLAGPIRVTQYTDRGHEVEVVGYTGDDKYCFDVRVQDAVQTGCGYSVPPRSPIEWAVSFVPGPDISAIYGTTEGRAALVELTFDDGSSAVVEPLLLVENGQVWASHAVPGSRVRIRVLDADGQVITEAMG